MLLSKFYLYPYYLLRRIFLILSFIFFRLYLNTKVKNIQKNNKNVWLFSERPNEAGDNAIALFKYVIKNHPEINARYVIKNKVKFKNKFNFEVYENLIEYNSIEHKVFFLASSHLISTHCRGYIEPWTHKILELAYSSYKYKKYIFLQHGVLKDDLSNKLSKSKNNFDIFICGGEPEYKDVLAKYGYTSKEIKYTGLARYDNLHNMNYTNTILLIPTWREYLRNMNDREFMSSVYYKHFQDILLNKKLNSILVKYNFKLVFRPHFEMLKFIHLFKNESQYIKISSQEETVKDLLIESKIMITDYSSVFFDFAYMKKYIIYDQFDKKTFYSSHYQKGYFDYLKDGFGPVCSDLKTLLEEVEIALKSNAIMEKKYKSRSENFFPLYDKKNCERIYNVIINANKKPNK